MSHARCLGRHVLATLHRVRVDNDRDDTVHSHTQPVQLCTLARIVAHELDGLDHEMAENVLCGHILSHVVGEAERQVRIDSIETLRLLHVIHLQLVGQANATPLLVQIDDHATVLVDVGQRVLQLLATVALLAVEQLAGHTRVVDAHGHALALELLELVVCRHGIDAMVAGERGQPDIPIVVGGDVCFCGKDKEWGASDGATAW